MQGLIQDYQLLILQEGENQTCSNTLVLLEILGRENQPQGWEIPVLSTL